MYSRVSQPLAQAGGGRRQRRLVALVSALSPAGALANTYNGLLYGGAASGGCVEQRLRRQQRRDAAVVDGTGGVQFHGFAYTAATFGASNDDTTGGLSAGFKGSGGSAPSDLNFPWTIDCSISEATPRHGSTPADRSLSTTTGHAGVAPGACNTSGNLSGWDFTNAEVESTTPGVNPATDYQTLTLSIWCARDCQLQLRRRRQLLGDQPVGATSTTPTTSPRVLSRGTCTIDSSSWYQTNTGNLNARGLRQRSRRRVLDGSDPLGADHRQCDARQCEPRRRSDVGSPIGAEFESGTDPCRDRFDRQRLLDAASGA